MSDYRKESCLPLKLTPDVQSLHVNRLHQLFFPNFFSDFLTASIIYTRFILQNKKALRPFFLFI